jgi:hypothetical protein
MREMMRITGALLVLVLAGGDAIFAQQIPVQTRPLPASLADTTFWRISSTFSEPGGYFQ